MSKKVKKTPQAKKVVYTYAIVDIGEDGFTLTTVYKCAALSDLEDFIQLYGYDKVENIPGTWRLLTNKSDLLLFNDDICFTKVHIDR